jgi:hypothetical protein
MAQFRIECIPAENRTRTSAMQIKIVTVWAKFIGDLCVCVFFYIPFTMRILEKKCRSALGFTESGAYTAL